MRFRTMWGTIGLLGLLLIYCYGNDETVQPRPMDKKKYYMDLFDQTTETLFNLIIDTTAAPPKSFDPVINEFDTLKSNIQIKDAQKIELHDVNSIIDGQAILSAQPIHFGIDFRFDGTQTLQEIAKRFYPSVDYWPKIYWENEELFTDLNIVTSNIVIQIPDLQINHPDLMILSHHSKRFVQVLTYLSSKSILTFQIPTSQDFLPYWQNNIFIDSLEKLAYLTGMNIQKLLDNSQPHDRIHIERTDPSIYTVFQNDQKLFFIDTANLYLEEDRIKKKMLLFIQEIQHFLGVLKQDSIQ